MKDISGNKYGSLIAIKFSYSDKNNQAFWQYKCNCGKTHIARANTITYAAKNALNKNDYEIPSCGCVELARKTKHGFRKAKDTHPIYKSYRGMFNRCYNPNVRNYKTYGAIGITICDEWLNNPEAFIEWSLANGWREGLTIDKDILCNKLKISPKIYSPSTCLWISKKENSKHITNKCIRENYSTHSKLKWDYPEIFEIYRQYVLGIKPVVLKEKYQISTTHFYRLMREIEKKINDFL